mmetsp:Transcript_9076/g.30014  ORF Transcript_9076/g.30014 Transcript_9076/m.30014 type:complete len:205 (+) Transcript_9076:1964-2578(+)
MSAICTSNRRLWSSSVMACAQISSVASGSETSSACAHAPRTCSTWPKRVLIVLEPYPGMVSILSGFFVAGSIQKTSATLSTWFSKKRRVVSGGGSIRCAGTLSLSGGALESHATTSPSSRCTVMASEQVPRILKWCPTKLRTCVDSPGSSVCTGSYPPASVCQKRWSCEAPPFWTLNSSRLPPARVITGGAFGDSHQRGLPFGR